MTTVSGRRPGARGRPRPPAARRLPPAGGPAHLAIIGLGAATTVTMVPIRPLTAPPAAVQPGTTQQIATNDVRILSAVARRRTPWLAGTDGRITRRDRELRSCLRILSVTGNRIGLDVDVGAADRSCFYPALAPARGGVVVLHGFAWAGEDPGLAAFAITAANRRTPELAIATGASPSLSDRFGNYIGAAADRIRPPCCHPGRTGCWPASHGRNHM